MNAFKPTTEPSWMLIYQEPYPTWRIHNFCIDIRDINLADKVRVSRQLYSTRFNMNCKKVLPLERFTTLRPPLYQIGSKPYVVFLIKHKLFAMGGLISKFWSKMLSQNCKVVLIDTCIVVSKLQLWYRNCFWQHQGINCELGIAHIMNFPILTRIRCTLTKNFQKRNCKQLQVPNEK